MIKQDLCWENGSRIYYETDDNGYVNRFVEYANSTRKTNAGKYYYLPQLQQKLKPCLDKTKIQDLYKDMIYVCDNTTSQYDQTLKDELCRRFGRYFPLYPNIDVEVFFTIIYLAMVDMEAGKLNHPNWLGKKIVLYSCKAVLLDDVDFNVAAEMYQHKHLL